MFNIFTDPINYISKDSANKAYLAIKTYFNGLSPAM